MHASRRGTPRPVHSFEGCPHSPNVVDVLADPFGEGVLQLDELRVRSHLEVEVVGVLCGDLSSS